MSFKFTVIGFNFFGSGANVELASSESRKDAELILRQYQEQYPNEFFAIKQGSTLIVLDEAKQVNDWDKEEELKPLNIKSPPDWNDYNQYLLDGGTLEYEDWTQR